MPRLALTLALLVGAAGAAQAQDQDQAPIRVGMSGGYPPFTFVQDDVLQGFEVDVMNAVGEELGRPVEFTTLSFSGLIGALEAGRIDTVANQITVTPEREAAFLFTQPYVIDGAQVVVREGNAEIGGVDDLAGHSVAVNLGSNFEQLLRELPDAASIDIRTYESNIEQDVALGRVDAFVMDRISTATVIRDSGLPLQLAGPPFSEIRNALPFRRDEAGQALRDEVDSALTALRADGTLTAISDRWFGTDITVLPGNGAVDGVGAAPATPPAAPPAPAAEPAAAP